MKLWSCEDVGSRGKLRLVATTKREGAHGFVYFHFLFEHWYFYTLEWNGSLLFHSSFPCSSTNNSVDVTHEHWFHPSNSQLVFSMRQIENIRIGPSEQAHSKWSLVYNMLLVSKNLSSRNMKEPYSRYDNQGWLENIAQHHHIVALLIRGSVNRHEKNNFRPIALHHTCIWRVLGRVLSTGHT